MRDDQRDRNAPGKGWNEESHEQQSAAEQDFLPGVAVPPRVGKSDVAQMRMQVPVDVRAGFRVRFAPLAGAEPQYGPDQNTGADGRLQREEHGLHSVAGYKHRFRDGTVARAELLNRVYGLVVAARRPGNVRVHERSDHGGEHGNQHGHVRGPEALFGLRMRWRRAPHSDRLVRGQVPQQDNGQQPLGDRDGDLGDQKHAEKFHKGRRIAAVRGRIGERELAGGGYISCQIAHHGGEEDAAVAAPAYSQEQAQHDPHGPGADHPQREQIGSQRRQSAMGQQQGLKNQRDQSQRGHGGGSEQVSADGRAGGVRGTARNRGHAQRT